MYAPDNDLLKLKEEVGKGYPSIFLNFLGYLTWAQNFMASNLTEKKLQDS